MKRFLLAMAVCLVAFSQAEASISYQLVTDQSSYTLSSAGTVVVNLFLQETTTGTSQSYLADTSATGGQGLFGFGLLVTRSSGTATLGTAVKNTTDFNGNFLVNPNGATQVGIQGDRGLTPGNGAVGTANTLGNGNGRTVLLASLNISATAGTSTFVLNDFSNFQPASNDTLAFKTLDGFNANQNGAPQGSATDWTGTIANGNFTFQVTVSAVPEPSSMALCGLALAGAGFGVYRRRKAKLAADAAAAQPA